MTRREQLVNACAAARSEPRRLEEAELGSLPEAARRYLMHAIGDGNARAVCAELWMRGTIKLGTVWRPFQAREILSPPHGFVWGASVRWGLLSILGQDFWVDGEGGLRWKLLGLVPVVSAGGPDVSRSACGRALSELVLTPPALLPGRGVRWSVSGDGWLTAALEFGGREQELRLRVDAGGRLESASVRRWGDPEGSWGEHDFGVVVEEEASFEGITIPARVRVGWWLGSERFAEGEFFRGQIYDARFR